MCGKLVEFYLILCFCIQKETVIVAHEPVIEIDKQIALLGKNNSWVISDRFTANEAKDM